MKGEAVHAEAGVSQIKRDTKWICKRREGYVKAKGIVEAEGGGQWSKIL